MEKRRVVITGLGAITPLGNSVAEFWSGIKAGKSGIGPITHFDASINKVHYAAEVKDFNPGDYMDPKEARKMARFSQYAVAAAKQALEDSKLLGNADVLDETGCILGVGIGGFEVTEASAKGYFNSGCTKTAPMTIPELIPNEAGGNIAMQFGCHGPVQAVSTACSSGTDAMGVAFDMFAQPGLMFALLAVLNQQSTAMRLFLLKFCTLFLQALMMTRPRLAVRLTRSEMVL